MAHSAEVILQTQLRPIKSMFFLIEHIPTFIKMMMCYIKNSVLHRLVSAVIRWREGGGGGPTLIQGLFSDISSMGWLPHKAGKHSEIVWQLFHIKKGTTMVVPRDSNPTEKQWRCHKPVEWLSELLSLRKAPGMSNATIAPHRVEILQI